MREAEQREIDGQLWTVTQFPATEGLKIFAGIFKLLGGALGKTVGGVEGTTSILDAKINMEILGSAIGDLAERLDEDRVVVLIKRMLKDTRCDNREVSGQFDLLFKAQYLTLFRVIAFVVEVNYQIPLADLLGSLGTRPETPEADLQSIRGAS